MSTLWQPWQVGESATYPDDQRRLGSVGKSSIRCHGVVCVVSFSGRYEKSRKESYGAFWRGAVSIGHERGLRSGLGRRDVQQSTKRHPCLSGFESSVSVPGTST